MAVASRTKTKNNPDCQTSPTVLRRNWYTRTRTGTLSRTLSFACCARFIAATVPLSVVVLAGFVVVATVSSTSLAFVCVNAKEVPVTVPVEVEPEPPETECQTGAALVDGTCLAATQTSSTSTVTKCELYLAPSTITGAGLGIFTAVSKRVGDTVGGTSGTSGGGGGSEGGGDICIPVVDLYWHNAQRGEHSGGTTALRKQQPPLLFNPFTDYFWDGHAMGMHEETNRNDIEALCPGLDCAINCHLALINVQKSVPQYDDDSDTTNNHQHHRHPGVGAYSPYFNGTTYVGRDIPAGGELFKYYGDNWFIVRHHVFGNIPLIDDYPAATTLLLQLFFLETLSRDATGASSDDEYKDWLFQQQKQGTAVPVPNKQRQQQEQHQRRLTLTQDLYETVIVPMKLRFDSRRLNALPNVFSDAIIAVQAKDVTVLFQPHHTVSVEQLETDGVCLDHLVGKPSTVPWAGHGAFATRALSAGTVITASPLHHVPSRSFFNMYNFTMASSSSSSTSTASNQKQEWIRLVDEIDQLQLLYNYCYGVSDSSLLLCPYGSGINFMNHNKTRQNVRIEWASSVQSFAKLAHNHTAVSDGTIADLSRSTKPQLAFEYIATRDIQTGEELFLDYGQDWEDAWIKHVTNYRGDRKNYASAHQWNGIFHDTSIRTESQQGVDPYPTNLQIRCHRTLLMRPPPLHNRNAEYKWHDKDYGLPCRILDRFWDEDSSDPSMSIELYTIQLEWLDDDDMDDDVEEDDEDIALDPLPQTVTWIEQTDVPRSALRFFDVPYTTDFHQPTSFRHFIGIPDDMFPSQWRDL